MWVKKAMSEWYGVAKEKDVDGFARERWGNDAGYAQQLLFLKARSGF